MGVNIRAIKIRATAFGIFLMRATKMGSIDIDLDYPN